MKQGPTGKREAIKKLHANIRGLAESNYCLNHVVKEIIEAFDNSLTKEQLEAIKVYAHLSYNQGVRNGRNIASL